MQQGFDKTPHLQERLGAGAGVSSKIHSCGNGFLGGIRSKAVPPNVLEAISGYDLLYDKGKCIQCGACLDRCTMMSITFDDDGYCVMDDYCVRCGQCALVCPVKARRLRARDISQTFNLSEDLFDDSIQMSKVRIVSGRIRDFTGDPTEVRWEPEDLLAQIEQQ